MNTGSTIDLTKLRDEVLSEGAQDYFGLYEIIWSLNGHYPRASRQEKVNAARKIILGLLDEGKIALFKTAWASNRYEPVPHAVAAGALWSDGVWQDPTDDPYFCYATA